jgi:hypothetical protein
MKTLTINLIAAGLMLAQGACKHTGRHVVIKSADNYNETRIEYYGRTIFNWEGTAILHISPNGSVEYRNNGQHLLAESDYAGHITYRINDGEKENQLSPQEKIFLADAVKDMIKHGHNDD